MLPDTSSIPPAVLEVLEALRRAGYEAYLVGGCVRDLYRGERPKDFDVATSALPAQVQATFKRVIPTGIEHGTVTVVLRGLHVEVTTFRAEAEYLDGRRPSKVDFHSDIEADLARRDFTINAMALEPSSQTLVDPFGGLADLAAGVVRCVRDPAERFAEDGLRSLRAVRFATVLGFRVDPATEAAIAPAVTVFRKVAPERIREELTRILLSPRVVEGLSLLHRTSLLAEILPELEPARIPAVGRAPPELDIRLAALLVGTAAPRELVLRLRYPNKVADDVAHLLEFRALPDETAVDGQIRRWLAAVGRHRAGAVVELNRALGGAVDALAQRLPRILSEQPPLSSKDLALNGTDIMAALAIGPSPAVGAATRFLLDLVLEHPSRNTPDLLLEALEKWKNEPH